MLGSGHDVSPYANWLREAAVVEPGSAGTEKGWGSADYSRTGSFERNEREAARTDRMGRLVTLNVCGSHGDLGGVMGSYCYVVRPYNTGSVRAIR